MASNWSGFAVGTENYNTGNYTSVSGTWTVPAAYYAQYPDEPSFEESSSWVGIGGFFTEGTLIQLGSDQYATSSGAIGFDVWYEIFPAAVVFLPSQYTVTAGDVITASVSCTAPCTPNTQQSWVFSMTNSTENWTWTDTVICTCSLDSAEWIEEAPGDVDCLCDPLPNYGSVEFSSVSANGANPNLTLSANGIIMEDPLGGVSIPGSPVNGNQFNVYYQPGTIFSLQGPKLVGTGAVGSNDQGFSIALSSDGNTAIVGGPEDDSNGAAWVYTRSNGLWTQQGNKLVGTGAVGNSGQGTSVALSSDGNTAIVGGQSDNSNMGAAWVFTRSNGVWTQQGSKLVGTGAVEGNNYLFVYQGASVALSSDGNTAIVGGYLDNSRIGAAWVFTRSNGAWTQQGSKLVGIGAVGSPEQGISVSLSSDGNTAIVGGLADNSFVGAAWVYTRSNGVWTQQGNKLVGSGAVGSSEQGISVSLSSDGNTAIVGGSGDNSSIGAAWVFTQSGGVWSQQGTKLVASDEAGAGSFGASVALSSDGNTAIIGGPGDSDNYGAAWVFTRSTGVWTQLETKLYGAAVPNTFGRVSQGGAVALSADGNTAIIGRSSDNNIGAAWVFVQLPTVTAINPNSGPVAGGTSVTITGTGFTDATGVTFDVAAATNVVVVNSDTITATTPAHAAGLVDVFVTTPEGTGIGAGAYTYSVSALTDTHDFNGDGYSDILFRNTGGTAAIWLMNGGAILSAGSLGTVASAWSIIGQRDFLGTGDADMLWRDTSGDLAMWFMNGLTVASTASLGNVPITWTVYGTADMNGDGIGDILWQDTAGDVAVWFMNGSTISSTAFLGTVAPSTGWSIIGETTGEILWRDTSGDLALWRVNRSTVQSTGLGTVPSNWVVKAVGDFNGDGVPDILWQDNNSGTVAIWFLNSSGLIQSTASVGVVSPSSGWTILDTGDYNGDGYSDILWTDGSGDLAVWFMNGATIASSAGLGNVGTTWAVQTLNAE
jgi:hypothetical protein